MKPNGIPLGLYMMAMSLLSHSDIRPILDANRTQKMGSWVQRNPRKKKRVSR